jgi:hypothetical protein
MTVTNSVQVKYPANTPVLPNVGTPNQFYPQGGFLRPWYADGMSTPGRATGDSSGGLVVQEMNFRPALGDQPIWVALSVVSVFSSELNAHTITLSGTLGSDWERPIHRLISLSSTSVINISHEMVEPNKPMYLGEGTVDNDLTFNIVYSVNTNTKVYQSFCRGWVSDRPFLTPLTIAP